MQTIEAQPTQADLEPITPEAQQAFAVYLLTLHELPAVQFGEDGDTPIVPRQTAAEFRRWVFDRSEEKEKLASM